MTWRDNWRVLVAETLTGQILADVVPKTMPTFTRALTDTGAWGVDVLIGAFANSTVDFHAYTRPGKYSWIIAHGNYIVQAGPVTTYQFDDATSTLSVSGSGLLGVFDHRVVRNPVGSANDPVAAIVNESEDLTYAGLSLPGIAAALIRDNLTQPGFALPLEVPEPGQGQAERTYYGYELATVWDRVSTLAEVIGGPELDCEPYFVPGENQIAWRLHLGAPLLGDQNTTAVWDYGGALGSINIDVNGADTPAARVWVKGDGSEREMLTGFAEDTSLTAGGYPPVDYVDGDHTSVTEQDTLEGYADHDLADRRWASESWACSVRVDGMAGDTEASPQLGSWSLGDAPTFYVDNHPWLPDGGYRRRITGYGDDGADHVALTLAETAETGLGGGDA